MEWLLDASAVVRTLVAFGFALAITAPIYAFVIWRDEKKSRLEAAKHKMYLIKYIPPCVKTQAKSAPGRRGRW